MPLVQAVCERARTARVRAQTSMNREGGCAMSGEQQIRGSVVAEQLEASLVDERRDLGAAGWHVRAPVFADLTLDRVRATLALAARPRLGCNRAKRPSCVG